MSKKLKIGLILLLAVFVAIGAAFYVVSTKIDPELIRKSAIEAIEGNLNDVKATIGEVSYTLGFTVKVNVKNLDISAAKSGDPLLRVADAKVEVPILSILSNGGTVDVKIEKPEVVLKELPGGSSNWKAALPTGEEAKKPSTGKKEESKGEVELPSFVENSRVDLKITDLGLTHIPLGKKPSTIQVEKILLKNLNLKKTTAFEVVSSLQYGIDQEKTVSANVQLVGEVALNNFFKTGAIDTNMLLNVDNIKASWLDLKVPALKNVIRFKMKEDGSIEAEVRTNGGPLSLETDVKVDKKIEKVSVNKMQLAVNLGGIPGIVGGELQEALKGIDFGKSEFKAGGTALINLKETKVDPNLSFSVEKPVTISVAEQPIAVSFKGRYVGDEASLKIKNELLSGVATLDANTRINPMKLPESIAAYNPVKAKLLITNVKLEKAFIQKLLYGDKAKAQSKAQPGQNEKVEEAKPISFPPFDLALEGKHIFINTQEMNLSGSVSGKNGIVDVNGLKMVYGPGSAKLNAKAKLATTQDISADFKLGLENMDMGGLNVFLPPMISEIQGKYEGNVSGALKKTKELSYDIKTDVKASNGELKNLNLSSFLLPLIESISFLKGKVDEDKLKISDKFDTMSLNARATEKYAHINKFNFVGNKKSVVLEAKGKVAMKETASSRVEANLVIDSVAKDVKQYSGTESIPVLLQGKGFVMLPVVKYTTDKLTERVGKKELEKQKKQLNKQIKKEQKKLEKDLQKKAKDLLKGFKL